MMAHLDNILSGSGAPSDRVGAVGQAIIRPCCYRTAVSVDAGYCGECGGALLRCAAFEECGGLLGAAGACVVCVSPELTLDAGSISEVRVGGELALPLMVHNRSRVGRPLFVKGLWTRESAGDWNPVEFSWDRLDGGASAPLWVRAHALDRVGEHQLEILIAFATRWRWREEVVAYTSGLAIAVEGADTVTVQQNIHYAAGAPQTGATVYAPLRVDGVGARRPTERAPSKDNGRPRVLTLTRAGRLERTFGLRGEAGEPRVPRGTKLLWRGFESGDAPADGPIVTRDGLFHLGRSRSKAGAGPNDVRVIVVDADGVVDEDTSREISRQHVALCIERDRLMLRVLSDRGAWVNDRHLAGGHAAALRDGDRFSPLARGRGSLSITARFEAHHGVVESITMTRRPGVDRGAPS